MTTTLPASSSSPPSELVGHQTPRIWTPPTGSPSHGATLARVAELAGIDLDEWQVLVVDVALEYDPDTRKWRRRTVVLLVARQNGKTVILQARVLAGLYAFDEHLILHTAQDRAVPRELFEDLVARIGDTPALHRRIAKRGIRETNGQERIRLKNGNTYRIVAPRAKAFRSWTADLLIFDEAREQHDEDLWGAAIPTQRVAPNPQVWAVSNAGDPDSVVLNRLRDRGRSAAQLGNDPTIAYLEWSAAPDRDLDDRAGWAEANPALGGRLHEHVIENELVSLTEERFRTEVLCQWVATATPAAVPWHLWDACRGDPAPYEHGLPRPVMGIHISGDRTHAALAMAVEREGRLIVDVVQEWRNPEGVDLLGEVAPDTLAWMKEYKVRELAYDRAAAAVIAQRVERRRLEVHRIDATEYVIASQNLHDAVASRVLMHRGNPSLDAQVAAAGRRTRPDDTWFISQADSSESITGLIAAAFAVNIAYRPVKRSAVHT